MTDPTNSTGTEHQRKNRTGRYTAIMLAVVVLYTVALYELPCSLLSGNVARVVVEWVARCVPMLDKIRSSPGYSPCYGMFVAGFWLISPLFAALGYQSVVGLPTQFLVRIRANSWRPYLLYVPFAIAILVYLLVMPTTTGVAGVLFNESSSFLPLRTISWCGVAFGVYFSGMAAGSVRVRFF